MPQPNAQNATAAAAEFLTRCFSPGETIALLLRREVPSATIQRIVQLETALAPRYLAWLAHENAAGANVYVAANPLRSDSRKRTKECIASVRHLYLDLDTDGEARLTSLRASDAVPPPNAVLSTSLGKYQILWRVDGFTLEQQESALKLLAITFGGDNIDKKLVDEFSKVKGKKVVPFKGWDTDLTEYLELYNDLAGK